MGLSSEPYPAHFESAESAAFSIWAFDGRDAVECLADEWTFKTMRAMLRNEARADGFGLRALGWVATALRVARRRSS